MTDSTTQETVTYIPDATIVVKKPGHIWKVDESTGRGFYEAGVTEMEMDAVTISANLQAGFRDRAAYNNLYTKNQALIDSLKEIIYELHRDDRIESSAVEEIAERLDITFLKTVYVHVKAEFSASIEVPLTADADSFKDDFTATLSNDSVYFSGYDAEGSITSVSIIDEEIL